MIIKNLVDPKSRTLLTVLGIAVGVAAVVACAESATGRASFEGGRAVCVFLKLRVVRVKM